MRLRTSFCHRCGIRFPEEFENEILTDATPVYLGFGATILNAATDTKNYLPNNVVETRTNHFGYLALDEFGYIQARRDAVLGNNSTSKIEPGLAISGFQRGRKRYQRELATRPALLPEPAHPESYTKLSVHCRSCDSRFVC